jgi:hypothetical protein
MKLRKAASYSGLAMFLILAPDAWLRAADLGPKDTSQLVDVQANVGSGPCPGGAGFKFDQLLRPDGSKAPFVIPAGKLLVITGIEIVGFSFAPGDTAQTRVSRHFGPQGIPNNLIARRESTANAEGRIFHVYEFAPGVAVASDVSVCVDSNLIRSVPPIDAILRGYLTEK